MFNIRLVFLYHSGLCDSAVGRADDPPLASLRFESTVSVSDETDSQSFQTRVHHTARGKQGEAFSYLSGDFKPCLDDFETLSIAHISHTRDCKLGILTVDIGVQHYVATRPRTTIDC